MKSRYAGISRSMGMGGIGVDLKTQARKKAVPATYYDGITWGAIADPKFGTTSILGVAQIGSRVYLVGGSGKVSYTTDGSTFTLQDIGAGTTGLYCVAGYGDVGLIMGASGKGYRTADGGASWAEVTTNFTATTIRGVCWYGTNKWIAVGNSGKNVISGDNGVTWQAQTVFTGGGTANRVAFDGTYLLVGSGTSIFYGTDGVNWTQASLGAATYAVAATPGFAWYGDQNGACQISTDHGANWSAGGDTQFGGRDAADIAYNPDNGVLMIVGQEGRANRSTDNGATFEVALKSLGGLTDNIYKIAFTDLGVFAVADLGTAAVSTSKS